MKKIFTILFVITIVLPSYAQKKDEIMNKISQLETRIDSSNKALQSTISQQKSSFENQIGKIESQATTQSEMSKALSNRLDNMEKQIKKLQDENAKLQATLDSLKKKKNTEDSYSPLTTEVDSIFDVIKHYGEAITLEERAQYVLHPEVTKPLMLKYYGNNYEKKFYDKKQITLSKFVFNNQNIVFISYYNLYLRKTGEGYKVDWEASVGYNPVTIDYYANKSSLTTLRVRANLRNFEVGNDSYYTVIAGGYYCYLKKGTTVANEVGKLMADGKDHKAIIEIRGDLDSDGGYTIDLVKLIREGWLE